MPTDPTEIRARRARAGTAGRPRSEAAPCTASRESLRGCAGETSRAVQRAGVPGGVVVQRQPVDVLALVRMVEPLVRRAARPGEVVLPSRRAQPEEQDPIPGVEPPVLAALDPDRDLGQTARIAERGLGQLRDSRLREQPDCIGNHAGQRNACCLEVGSQDLLDALARDANANPGRGGIERGRRPGMRDATGRLAIPRLPGAETPAHSGS